METPSPPRPPRASPPRSSPPKGSPPRRSPPRGSPPRHDRPPPIRTSPPKRNTPSPRPIPSPRASPSPRRGALHERSDSRNNERSSRMLRMVGNPEASTYGPAPYPTKPSHILAPSPSPMGGGPPSPYEMMARAQSRLSEHTRDTWVPTFATRARKNDTANAAPHTPLTPNYPEGYSPKDSQQPDSTFYASTDDSSGGGKKTPEQDKRTSYYEDTSSSPEPIANKSFLEPRSSDESSTGKGRPSGESVVQLPSVPPRAEDHSYPMSSSMTQPFSDEYPAVPPRAEGHINPIPSPVHSQFNERQPSNKESDTSLGSANSTGTMVVKKARDGKKRASYSAFPSAHHSRPSSSKSNLPPSTPPRPYRNDSEESVAPRSPVSPSSPGSEPYSTTRPISSIPNYSNLQEVNSKAVGVQYPVIEPPKASGSWAQISTPPQRPPKAADRNTERWNPHLSTVLSLGSSSPSADPESEGTWPFDSSRGSKTSSNLTKYSPRISSDFPPVPRRSSEFSVKEIPDSSSSAPSVNRSRLASPPPVRQKDFTGSRIRKVDENEVSSFSPPSIKTSQTAKSSVMPSPDPQGGERRGTEKRSSTASFFKELPSWAKSYYARPDSTIFDRSGSRTSADILNAMSGRKGSKDLLNEKGKGLALTDPSRASQRLTKDWSPHLWHDRTSLGRRRSLFKAPSLDERAEGRALNKRNIQIALFAIGFIFPPSWFVASALPLPSQPNIPSMKGKDSARTSIMEDLEKNIAIPLQEARYENARWWRNINRMMAFVGIIVLICVVALAVVGAHTS